MRPFGKKRVTVVDGAEPDASPISFQLVPDQALLALGAWGRQFLDGPLYRTSLAAKNTIILPDQIANWLRAEPGPTNHALDCYHSYVATAVASLFERAVKQTNLAMGTMWSDPISALASNQDGTGAEWNALLCRSFAGQLAGLIDNLLKPRVCSGELPISMAAPIPFRPRRAPAMVAPAKAPRTQGSDAPDRTAMLPPAKPMAMVTYAGNLDHEAVLAPLVATSLGERLTGPIAGTAQGGSLILPMRAGPVVVMPVDAPMPLPPGPDDFAQRSAWETWRHDAASWRSHVVVAAFGTPESLAAARIYAEDVITLASVLAAGAGARGVTWCGSELIYPAAEFIARCRAQALPPDILFRTIWYRGQSGHENGLGARTQGLRLFGLPEIDHRPTGASAPVVYNQLLNLAAYLLASGLIVRDGDTIGIDERVQAQIRHRRNDAGELRLVVLPAEDAPLSRSG